MVFPQKISRAEMARFVLSIAKTAIAVTLEEPLEHLATDIIKLYTGFLNNHRKTDTSLTVSYDSLTTYLQSGENQIRLPEKGNPKTVEIVDRIGSVYKLSDDSLVVGYKNGCLAYNRFSKKGHLLLFRTKEPGLLIVSLYKFLFLFISLILAEQEKLLVHGTGIEKGENGYLFLGESGAGKSTISGFVKEGNVLSDDSPVIGRENDAFYIYAFPYSQVNMFDRKSRDYHLNKTELKKLFFLQKSNRLFVKPRDKKSALGEIIKKHIHSFEFMSSENRTVVFNMCYDLCRNIPAYDLHFQRNDTFWDII